MYKTDKKSIALHLWLSLSFCLCNRSMVISITVKEIIYTCKSLYFILYKDLYVYRQQFLQHICRKYSGYLQTYKTFRFNSFMYGFPNKRQFHFQTLPSMASIPMHTVLSSARYGCADLMP